MAVFTKKSSEELKKMSGKELYWYYSENPDKYPHEVELTYMYMYPCEETFDLLEKAERENKKIILSDDADYIDGVLVDKDAYGSDDFILVPR